MQEKSKGRSLKLFYFLFFNIYTYLYVYYNNLKYKDDQKNVARYFELNLFLYFIHKLN